MERIELARFRWPWLWIGIIGGGAGAATTSGSSSSNDPWQRRQRLLIVRNWTSRQRSQRITSLESTGARFVAIQVGSGQSGLPRNQTWYLVPNLVRNLRHKTCGSQVKSRNKRHEVSMKGEVVRLNTGENKYKTMKDRAAAWCLLTEFTQSESLRKHAMAVEACMRAYAGKFQGDPELWGVVGLLHDFDYDMYPGDRKSVV